MTALKKLQHNNELRGMKGPNFRPGLCPLFSDEWHENLLHCLDQTEINADEPLLVVVPTLHARAAWIRDILRFEGREQARPLAHFPKSLLEYHYRLNQSLAGVSGGEAPACVGELWCVVVNKSEHPLLLGPLHLLYNNTRNRC